MLWDIFQCTEHCRQPVIPRGCKYPSFDWLLTWRTLLVTPLLLETAKWAVWLFVRIAVFVGFVQLSLLFVLWVRSLVLTVCCHCVSDETGPCSAWSIYEISTPVAVILACVSEMMISCQCGKRGRKPWNFASGHVHHDSLTA